MFFDSKEKYFVLSIKENGLLGMYSYGRKDSFYILEIYFSLIFYNKLWFRNDEKCRRQILLF